MMSAIGNFEIVATEGLARAAKQSTSHGDFETPAFMPVGTQATVKAVNPRQLKELGTQILLSNTYHLFLRPGDEVIKALGGLHQFMNWHGPILTDSGGFQVFSLAKLRKISEEGVQFNSHLNGAKIFFTPEKVVEIQENLGVDIMMVLDECLAYPAELEAAEKSLDLTTRWAERSVKAKKREQSLIFGIVQGGMFPQLRKQAATRLIEIGFDGYAIGGLSVGESQDLMLEMVGVTTEVLPQDKARYLMGVGTPRDIVLAVALGIDMFDCVIPTRSARFGRLYIDEGYLNIRNEKYRQDNTPILMGCDCYSCQNFSKAYIAHLIHCNEMLGLQLATIHNLRFYQRLMFRIREAIKTKQFANFLRDFLSSHVYSTNKE